MIKKSDGKEVQFPVEKNHPLMSTSSRVWSGIYIVFCNLRHDFELSSCANSLRDEIQQSGLGIDRGSCLAVSRQGNQL